MKLDDYFSGPMANAVNINQDRLNQLADHEEALGLIFHRG
jgi:hypothetical protein